MAHPSAFFRLKMWLKRSGTLSLTCPFLCRDILELCWEVRGCRIKVTSVALLTDWQPSSGEIIRWLATLSPTPGSPTPSILELKGPVESWLTDQMIEWMHVKGLHNRSRIFSTSFNSRRVNLTLPVNEHADPGLLLAFVLSMQTFVHIHCTGHGDGPSWHGSCWIWFGEKNWL